MKENKNEIILFKNQSVKLEVNVKEETVWLNRHQIAELFGRDVKTIGKHISNAQKEELKDVTTVAKFATVQKEGEREVLRYIEYYNLDMILSIGYRVKSSNGIIFRQWANKVLKEYLLKGYVINDERSLVTNENYIRLINKVESLDERVSYIETEYKPVEFKKSQLFFDGQLYDAYTLIQQIFESASSEIIIIDNYVD